MLSRRTVIIIYCCCFLIDVSPRKSKHEIYISMLCLVKHKILKDAVDRCLQFVCVYIDPGTQDTLPSPHPISYVIISQFLLHFLGILHKVDRRFEVNSFLFVCLFLIYLFYICIYLFIYLFIHLFFDTLKRISEPN
jgi:hypothetical protein